MKTPIINLKNLNIEEIHAKYDLIEVYKDKTNKTLVDTVKSQNKKSKVDMHNSIDNENVYSYLDESKKKHTCLFTMKDYINKNALNNNCLKCFWCRNHFETMAIGVPIEYVSSKIHKQYLNEYTKTKYTFSENFTNKKHHIDNHNKKNLILEKEPLDFYWVDGQFCSFNCTKAFIEDNKNNAIYANSISLLHKIYSDLFPENKVEIHPAPSWRLLKEYGGDFSIEEFRKSFSKQIYVQKTLIKELPSYRNIGFVFEKNIIL